MLIQTCEHPYKSGVDCWILYVICPQCSKCWSELVHTHLWLRLKTCQRAVRPRNQARRWPTGILWNSGIHSSTAPGSRSGNQLYFSTRSNGWDILLVCYTLIYDGCGYPLFIVNLTKAKLFWINLLITQNSNVKWLLITACTMHMYITCF